MDKCIGGSYRGGSVSYRTDQDLSVDAGGEHEFGDAVRAKGGNCTRVRGVARVTECDHYACVKTD